MPTFSEAVERLEAQVLTGRDGELAAFERWLSAPQEAVEFLNVTGPAGVGKSALLRAFARTARREGRPVVAVDGAALADDPTALLQALGAETLDEVIAQLNDTHPLLAIDTVNDMSTLTGLLQEILSALDIEVRVVIASRLPLATAWGSRWAPLIDTMLLGGLSRQDADEYLRKRGIEDPHLRAEVRAAGGRFPLSLALAADMVVHLGLPRLEAAPQWQLALHSLVEQLVSEVEDASLRELLDVCAVVRRFDEALLQTLSEAPEVSPAFRRLSSLSIVRPAHRGLMLHGDIRRMLASDLRWRRPDRYRDLRLRALEYYRERSQGASPGERADLIADRFYLWENALVQAMMFEADDPGEIWVDGGRDDDIDTIIGMWFAWLDRIPAPQPPDESQRDIERAWLYRFLRHAGLRRRVFRNSTGALVGFTTVMPLYAGSVDLLRSHPYRAEVVRAYLEQHPETALPDDPADAQVTYMFQLSVAEGDAAAYAAILRDAVGFFAGGGVFIASPIPAEHRALSGALGFQPLPNAESEFRGIPFDGVVLDLSHNAFETWIEAVMSGRRMPPRLSPPAFERELHAVLVAWRDDDRLAASPLAVLAESATDAPVHAVAESLRQVVAVVLERLAESAPREDEPAYRAVQMAYLQRSLSHERLAERLNVSRSTFYRLLKRGVAGLAGALQSRS